MDPTPIVERVARTLHVDPADVDVIAAVDAAIAFVAVTELVAPANTPADVPDDPVTVQGMVGFARALYVDTSASRGASVALADGTVGTVFTPEDIYRHWRHFFAPLAAQWGVA